MVWRRGGVSGDVVPASLEDHSPRQACRFCKTHCFLDLSQTLSRRRCQDTHVKTYVVASFPAAPLLTDTRRSTVGPGTLEDFVVTVYSVVMEYIAPALALFKSLVYRSTAPVVEYSPVCSGRSTCASGGAHRVSSCCNRIKCAVGAFITPVPAVCSICAVVETLRTSFCSNCCGCASNGVHRTSSCRNCGGGLRSFTCLPTPDVEGIAGSSCRVVTPAPAANANAQHQWCFLASFACCVGDTSSAVGAASAPMAECVAIVPNSDDSGRTHLKCLPNQRRQFQPCAQWHYAGDHRSDDLSGDVGELSVNATPHQLPLWSTLLSCLRRHSLYQRWQCQWNSSLLLLGPSTCASGGAFAPSPAVGYAFRSCSLCCASSPYSSSLSSSACAFQLAPVEVASRGLMCFGQVSVGFCHAAREV